MGVLSPSAICSKGISGYVSNYYLTNYKKIDVDSSGSLQKEARTYASTSNIKLNNDCYKTATITIGSKKYTIAPHSSITATGITAGKYKIIASAPGVIPYVGSETIEPGYLYSWKFYISSNTSTTPNTDTFPLPINNPNRSSTTDKFRQIYWDLQNK